MIRSSVLILCSAVLLCSYGSFMSDELAKALLKSGPRIFGRMDPRGFEKDLLVIAVYEVETLDFNAIQNDIDEMLRVQFAPGQLNCGDETEYRTILAGQALRLYEQYENELNRKGKPLNMDQTPWEMLIFAKIPVPTRIGKLLYQQHMVWLKESAKLQNIKDNHYEIYQMICDVRNKRRSLIAQTFCILGFVNWKHTEPSIFLMKLMADSEYFDRFFDGRRMMLPSLDRLVTYLLNDPFWVEKRNDQWSTLPGFQSNLHLLSKHDQMVIDILKMHGINYHPNQLFKK